MTLSWIFFISSSQFNLPTGLLESVCKVESNFKVTVIHKDDGKGNSIGVCQVKLSTAKWMGFEGTERELMQPEVNTYYAAKYLKHQLVRYGQVERALIGYNQGSAKTALKTRYSDKVISVWRKYGSTNAIPECQKSQHNYEH